MNELTAILVLVAIGISIINHRRLRIMALGIADLQAAIAQQTTDLASLEAKVNLLTPQTVDLTNEVAAVAANDTKINDLTAKVTAITG